MSPEFVLTFDREIALVCERLERERQALATEEKRDESQRLRVRVQYTEKLLARLKSDRTAILGASAAIDEMEKRFLRWSGICAECREAEDQKNAVEKQLTAARELCLPASNAVALAERELQQQRAAALPSYPTEPEIARKKAAEETAAQKHQDALAVLRLRANERDELQRRWIEASAKFDALCFKERMSRLPGEPEPYRSEGVLSTVG